MAGRQSHCSLLDSTHQKKGLIFLHSIKLFLHLTLTTMDLYTLCPRFRSLSVLPLSSAINIHGAQFHRLSQHTATGIISSHCHKGASDETSFLEQCLHSHQKQKIFSRSLTSQRDLNALQPCKAQEAPLKETVFKDLRLLESSGGRPEPKEKSCGKMALTVAQDVQRKTLQGHSLTFSWRELSSLAASLKKVQGKTGDYRGKKRVSEVEHQALTLLEFIYSY